MNKTLYIVHSDTEQGAQIEVFTTPEAEQAFCNNLMLEAASCRAANAKLVSDLIAQGSDDARADAWVGFTDQSEGQYHRHEVDVELPDPNKALIEVAFMAIECAKHLPGKSNHPLAVEARAALKKAGVKP